MLRNEADGSLLAGIRVVALDPATRALLSVAYSGCDGAFANNDVNGTRVTSKAGLAFASGEVAIMVNWFGFAAMALRIATRHGVAGVRQPDVAARQLFYVALPLASLGLLRGMDHGLWWIVLALAVGVSAALAGGETTYDDQYFRTAPVLECGDPRYAWVNTTAFVARGSWTPATADEGTAPGAAAEGGQGGRFAARRLPPMPESAWSPEVREMLGRLPAPANIFSMMAHAVIIYHASVLFLPLLFFVCGLPLDLMIFIGFYGWAMSWQGTEIPASPGARGRP